MTGCRARERTERGDTVAVQMRQADVDESIGLRRARIVSSRPAAVPSLLVLRGLRSRAGHAELGARRRCPRRARAPRAARPPRRGSRLRRLGRRLDRRQMDDELAALARPFAAASTRPPCSSTSRRTSVRPMPRPPCERSRPRSPCTNRSKMRGNSSGSRPRPESRTRTRPRRPRAAREHDRCRPPAACT